MRSYKKGTSAASKIAALIGLIFLTGCGSGSNHSTLPPIGNVPGGIVGGGGCVPIQAPIPFSGQNIRFDSHNLVGGSLPPMDPWPTKFEGTVILGGGAAGGYGTQQLQGSSSDGYLQMTIMTMNQPIPPGQTYPGGGYYPQPLPMYTGRANVQGTLTLSPAVQQEIMMYLGGYNVGIPNWGTYPGTNPGYPQQPYPQQIQACASGIAFNMGYQVTMPYGKLYLYLNNTQHGIALVF